MAGWRRNNINNNNNNINSRVGFGAFVLLWLIVHSAGAARVSLNPRSQSSQVPQTSPQRRVVAEPSSSGCSVESVDRVPCGEPGIAAAECEAIHCCFEEGQCYYGKAVTVQCTRDGQFIVVVAKAATVPQLSLDSITLMEVEQEACTPVDSTAAYVIYQFPVTACGTTVTEEDGYLVYENRMISSYEVAIGPRGLVTRDSSYELLFQCRYSGVTVEALVVEVNEVPPPESLVVPGPLRVELRLGSGQCSAKGCVDDEEAYTSYYTEADYPVTKVLRQPVYVEVRILERTDPNLVLQLGNCWATSRPDPLSEPQWDLLVNGCPYGEDHYQTMLLPVTSSNLQYPTHYKRFAMKMFTFVDSETMLPMKETVFIHCNTMVCYPSDKYSCEQTCHRQKRDASDQDAAKPSILVSSGEVHVINPEAE